MIATTPVLAGLLGRTRIRASSEAEVQRAIAHVFTGDGIPFDREVEIGEGDRIDFVVGGSIGVEVKVDGSLSSVTRQLHRYASSPLITELVLVTTRMRHRHMPAAINGKSITVVHLLGSVF